MISLRPSIEGRSGNTYTISPLQIKEIFVFVFLAP